MEKEIIKKQNKNIAEDWIEREEDDLKKRREEKRDTEEDG